MKHSSSFADKRIAVIGATGGIGRSTAIAFADAGATVVAAGRSLDKLTGWPDEASITNAFMDILEQESIEAFFAEHGEFDHLVCTAASTKTGSMGDLALHDAEAAMASKFWGAYRVARSALLASNGSITFVSGQLSERPSATSVLQGAINAAIEAMGRGLALERAPLRVNTVSPGIIDTPLHDRIPLEQRKPIFEKIASSLPARRIGSAEDVAEAILFCAGNAFVTGATINVDGGGRIA